MTINFYLDDEKETPITSFYEMSSNPFKVGDVVSLGVDDTYPAQYQKYTPEYAAKIREQSEELINKFRHKQVLLTKEGKYVRFCRLGDTNLTIEYHCVFTD